jgi:hypothetical protein
MITAEAWAERVRLVRPGPASNPTATAQWTAWLAMSSREQPIDDVFTLGLDQEGSVGLWDDTNTPAAPRILPDAPPMYTGQ